ncbi:MAG: GNAT family N-acetyltransferase, partial [candidate division Zixibacteria bacterium]
GEINSRDCLARECEIWNDNPPDSDNVLKFIDQQQITPGFDRFMDYLRDSNIKARVLSEGFDFYIVRILDSAGFGDIEKITNKAAYENGIIIPRFPHFGEGCGRCSNCKGYHIGKIAKPFESVIFIGDGHSDAHACEKADIIFAKSFLKEHLENSGIFYFGYNDFDDILSTFRVLAGKSVFLVSKRMRLCVQSNRHRAQLQSLWESGEVMKYVGFPNGLGWSAEKHEKNWKRISADRENIYLALEDENGRFLGEAMLAAPDQDNVCAHDLKLLPEYWGKGLAKEAWEEMLAAGVRRWPGTKSEVTPSVENGRALRLYRSLGFVPDGDEGIWDPDSKIPNAVPVRYVRMLRE